MKRLGPVVAVALVCLGRTAMAGPPTDSAAAPPASTATDTAAAPPPSNDSAETTKLGSEEEVEWHRRADFQLGLHLGIGLGASIGYPNDALKIDRPEFETNTGASIGGAGTVFIGGALADWLNFAIALSGARMRGGGYDTTSASLGFHTEFYPAFSLGDLGEEFGIYLDAGIALMTAQAPDSDSPAIESGGAARFGFGGFYEGIRVWQLSMGPYVGADVIWSPSCSRPVAVLGWRTALYSGP